MAHLFPALFCIQITSGFKRDLQPNNVIGNLLCKFITGGGLGWAAATASSFLLVAIAVECYYATLHPLQTLSRGCSSWLVPGLWILAILLIMPSLVLLAYDAESQMCAEDFPDYTTTRAYNLTWSFASSVLPICCIIGYLYARIIISLRNRAVVPGSSQAYVSQSRNGITKMLISVSVIFITCWTPPAVLCVLIPVIPGGSTVYPVTTACALLNSCLNPLVYTRHSQQFRKNLASLVSCCKKKSLPQRKHRKQTVLKSNYQLII
ncbi:hypothetical protein OS493_010663 [Desmophyllum pertusum]|uniref:G-protein coupled receptors family 1 profile domain-containing protein n=1 Tax=Desmophyllum pertusum TaxID=174260 RepID=A0A9W9ZUK3_9CNID|nr:hypothetical protein OS493_010663 [Desmophyllum pertusum]